MRAAWDRFWYEARVSGERLATLRLFLFGVLAVDLWLLMVTRAYRVGAGDFNLAEVPLLDALLPMPTAEIYVVAYLLAGFLAAGVAAGLRGRWAVWLLAALYGLTYLWSQHDGFQHHWFLALLLVLACFVPWDARPDAPARSWAIRLIYVQVALLYLFSSIAKMDPHWLNGWTMERIVSTEWVREMLAGFGDALGMDERGPYAVAAWSVMLWELVAAAAMLVPKLRAFACVTGVFFHVMVMVIGLEVAFFSWYMIVLYYLLLFPERWFEALSRPVGDGLAWLWRRARRAIRWAWPAWARWPLALAGAAASAAIAAVQPYPAVGWLAACVAAVMVARELTARGEAASASAAWRRSATQALACLAMAWCSGPGGAAYEYWRLDGGDLARRGDVEGAIASYERAIHVAPERPSRERRLAELYAETGRLEEAVTMFERALTYDAEDARAREGLEGVRRRLERRR